MRTRLAYALVCACLSGCGDRKWTGGGAGSPTSTPTLAHSPTPTPGAALAAPGRVRGSVSSKVGLDGGLLVYMQQPGAAPERFGSFKVLKLSTAGQHSFTSGPVPPGRYELFYFPLLTSATTDAQACITVGPRGLEVPAGEILRTVSTALASPSAPEFVLPLAPSPGLKISPLQARSGSRVSVSLQFPSHNGTVGSAFLFTAPNGFQKRVSVPPFVMIPSNSPRTIRGELTLPVVEASFPAGVWTVQAVLGADAALRQGSAVLTNSLKLRVDP